ncbi:MAG: TolC family protein [Sedimentisphaerales bacterium]|nr:TolC family protein [Sedimentisphaerales bacterium]
MRMSLGGDGRTMKSLFQIILSILVLSGLCLLLTTGCESTPEAYKAEADHFAYNAIEAQWDRQFGLKTNLNIDEPRLSREPEMIKTMLPEDGKMSLPMAVAIATKNNRRYQTEKENLYRVALDLRLVRHIYEPNPFAVFGAGYTEFDSRDTDITTETATIVGLGDVVTDVDESTTVTENSKWAGEADVGFDMLLSTGARIGVRLAMGYTDIIRGDIDDGFGQLLGIVIEQPLMRGAGREIALEQLTQAERNVLYQIRTFNRFRQQFVVDVISQYLRVVQLQDNLENARINQENLQDIYNKMKALTEALKMPAFELEEAWQENIDAQDRYAKAKREYDQALDEFKLVLALPPQTEFQLDTTELERLRTYPTEELGFPEQKAVEVAVQHRLDLANATDTVIDAERKIHVALDSIRTELNLVGMANSEVGERESFGTLLGVVRGEDTFRVGVEVDLPLDRLDEKNAYRNALIDLEQAKRIEEEIQDTVVLEVRTAYRNLNEANDRFRIQTEGYGLANKRLENTILLLQYSKTGIRDVLRAQRDFYNARLESTDAIVDFTIAAMEFYRDTGLLQVLPDGMWQKPDTTAAAENTDPKG